MGACSIAVGGMALLSVLCRATEAAAGVARAGSRVMLFPVVVALHGLDPSSHGLGVGNHAK
jgi:hypothetical protein